MIKRIVQLIYFTVSLASYQSTSLIGALSLSFTFHSSLVIAESVPFKLPTTSELAKLRSAILETDKGQIIFELYPDDAPWHVANLKILSDRGFYKNTRFYYFDSDFIIQGGSPKNNSGVEMKYSLPPEFNHHKHTAGTLSMARKPDDINPQRRSSSNLFSIILRDSPQMDGHYTVVGQIIKGFDVLSKLRSGDTIINFTVYVKDYNPNSPR